VDGRRGEFVYNAKKKRLREQKDLEKRKLTPKEVTEAINKAFPKAQMPDAHNFVRRVSTRDRMRKMLTS